jgi:pre-mRNA-splicing factor 18
MPVGGIDAIKSLLQQTRAEKQELVGGKKYVKKSELEEARLKRLREEEEAERRAKVSS